jgi:DHA2 family multidrug resistance protein
LSNLPLHILRQGTALGSLMRISAAASESRSLQHCWRRAPRPSIPGSSSSCGQTTRSPALYLAAPFSLTNPAGIAALKAEVTRQPAMVAYLNDIALVMIMALGSCIQLLLVRPPPLPTPKPAIAVGAASGPAKPIWRRRLPRRHIADPNKSARSAVAQCAS